MYWISSEKGSIVWRTVIRSPNLICESMIGSVTTCRDRPRRDVLFSKFQHSRRRSNLKGSCDLPELHQQHSAGIFCGPCSAKFRTWHRRSRQVDRYRGGKYPWECNTVQVMCWQFRNRSWKLSLMSDDVETTDEESVTQIQSENGPVDETTYRKAVNQIQTTSGSKLHLFKSCCGFSSLVHSVRHAIGSMFTLSTSRRIHWRKPTSIPYRVEGLTRQHSADRSVHWFCSACRVGSWCPCSPDCVARIATNLARFQRSGRRLGNQNAWTNNLAFPNLRQAADTRQDKVFLLLILNSYALQQRKEKEW